MMCIINPANKWQFKAESLTDAENVVRKWCLAGIMPGREWDYVIGTENADDYWAVKVR